MGFEGPDSRRASPEGHAKLQPKGGERREQQKLRRFSTPEPYRYLVYSRRFDSRLASPFIFFPGTVKGAVINHLQLDIAVGSLLHPPPPPLIPLAPIYANQYIKSNVQLRIHSHRRSRARTPSRPRVDLIHGVFVWVSCQGKKKEE